MNNIKVCGMDLVQLENDLEAVFYLDQRYKL